LQIDLVVGTHIAQLNGSWRCTALPRRKACPVVCTGQVGSARIGHWRLSTLTAWHFLNLSKRISKKIPKKRKRPPKKSQEQQARIGEITAAEISYFSVDYFSYS
jgi:hypothetical protein